MSLHPSFHARAHADRPACIDALTGESLSYGELEAASNRAAHLLRRLGLARGDGVAFMLDNSADLFVLVVAAQRIGLYYTALPTGLSPEEAAYIVADSGARVLVMHEAHALRMGPAWAQALSGCHCLCWGAGGAPGFGPWEALVAAEPASPVADESPGRDLLYSSGTTGRPKGVRLALPEGGIGDPSPQLGHLQRAYGMDADTVYLSPAPLYHAAPLRTSLNLLRLGGCVVYLRKFDALQALHALQRWRVTHSQWVPTMFVKMLKLPEAVRAAFDLSRHRCAIHGAAPCPPQVKRDMIRWWGPILMEYYAATESVGLVVCDAREWLAHPGTVGRAVIGTLHILDEAHRELPPGQEGLVYFGDGPRVAYHNDPGKTAQAHSPQGWFTLGDVGYLDDEGYLYLTDRKAFMIISGGVNIYPQEVENALLEHPAVGDVAVFGVPDEEFGEKVMAVVEPARWNEAGPWLEGVLTDYCKARLAPAKVPRAWAFEQQLPRMDTGKLAKRALRDRHWAGTGRRI